MLICHLGVLGMSSLDKTCWVIISTNSVDKRVDYSVNAPQGYIQGMIYKHMVPQTILKTIVNVAYYVKVLKTVWEHLQRKHMEIGKNWIPRVLLQIPSRNIRHVLTRAPSSLHIVLGNFYLSVASKRNCIVEALTPIKKPFTIYTKKGTVFRERKKSEVTKMYE